MSPSEVQNKCGLPCQGSDCYESKDHTNCKEKIETLCRYPRTFLNYISVPGDTDIDTTFYGTNLKKTLSFNFIADKFKKYGWWYTGGNAFRQNTDVNLPFYESGDLEDNPILRACDPDNCTCNVDGLAARQLLSARSYEECKKSAICLDCTGKLVEPNGALPCPDSIPNIFSEDLGKLFLLLDEYFTAEGTDGTRSSAQCTFKKLSWLGLSNTAISYFPKNSFNDLSVNVLDISRNNLTCGVHKGAFSGLAIQHIFNFSGTNFIGPKQKNLSNPGLETEAFMNVFAFKWSIFDFSRWNFEVGTIAHHSFDGLYTAGQIKLDGLKLQDHTILYRTFDGMSCKGLRLVGSHFPNNTLPPGLFFGANIEYYLDIRDSSIEVLETTQDRDNYLNSRVKYNDKESGSELGPLDTTGNPSECTWKKSHEINEFSCICDGKGAMCRGGEFLTQIARCIKKPIKHEPDQKEKVIMTKIVVPIVVVSCLLLAILFYRYKKTSIVFRGLSRSASRMEKLIKEQDDELLLIRRQWQIHYDDIVFNKRLGSGSYGDVWAAKWNVGLANVALIINFLKHPLMLTYLNIVSWLFLCPNLTPPDINRLASKGSLRAYLDIAYPSWTRKIEFCQDIANGMQYLHSRSPPFIHRDLKADNCLIDSNFVVKVCDFGSIMCGFSQEIIDGPKYQGVIPPSSDGTKDTELKFVTGTTEAGTPVFVAPEIWKSA
eukprot:UC4_evm10s575